MLVLVFYLMYIQIFLLVFLQRFAAVIMRIREPKTTALIFASGKMVSVAKASGSFCNYSFKNVLSMLVFIASEMPSGLVGLSLSFFFSLIYVDEN